MSECERGISALNNLSYKWPERGRVNSACVSECEGWGYSRVVPTRVSSLVFTDGEEQSWSHYSPTNSHQLDSYQDTYS